MRNDLYESQIEGKNGQHRQSLDVLNLSASPYKVDGIDFLAMVKDEDDH